METPEFIAGSIKRFSEFVSQLNDKEKIALVSHTDHDGLAAAKIANEVIQADFLDLKDYEELTLPFINQLKKQKIKYLILTDLSLTNPDFLPEAEKHFKILIIDHHLFDVDLNSEKTVYLNAKGFCAAYLCYYLFSKIQNLQKYDWLVACASIADWTFLSAPVFLKETMEKYEDTYVIENNIIRKSGKFWDLQFSLSLALIYLGKDLQKAYNIISSNIDSLKNFEKYAKPVQEEITSTIKRFEKERIPIKEGYFWEFSPRYDVGSIISSIISEKEKDKKYIICRQKEGFFHISIRRQDGKENVAILLQSLVSGLEKGNAGGHVKAAGGQVDIKEADKVRKRILALK